MKAGIILLIIIGFSNLGFSQIKSERKVEYWFFKKAGESDFHKVTSNDSCVIFWEEYNRYGKITKEYDFPADRCWQINGPWEHHYFYDNDNRLIEHRDFGGEEGKTRTLMKNFFYSYPYLNEPYKANEFYYIYNYRGKTISERQQIDTFYLNIQNTKRMFEYSKTGWKFDTIKVDKGEYIFRKDFVFNEAALSATPILPLLGKKNITEFEIALLKNLQIISNNLSNIYGTEENNNMEIEFRETENKTSIKFILSAYFIKIEYIYLNQSGDGHLSFFYRYARDESNLEKLKMVKSYIEYY